MIKWVRLSMANDYFGVAYDYLVKQFMPME